MELVEIRESGQGMPVPYFVPIHPVDGNILQDNLKLWNEGCGVKKNQQFSKVI